MMLFRWFTAATPTVAMLALVGGCQMQPLPDSVNATLPGAGPVAGAERISIDLPQAWGGEVRCTVSGCLLGAVEHEKNTVVLHRLEGRTARLLDRQPVAYHPDSAVWLSDSLLAAAVETSAGLDVFRVDGERLTRVQQLPIGFGPRDVVLIEGGAGRFRLLATPYKGTEVAWIDWHEDNRAAANVEKSTWCEAPWHPTRVSKLPGAKGGGVAVACLDDRKVVAVSDANMKAPPQVLASFNAIPRQARPSPSGQWLYVALETGERNARIHMDSGELQWIAAPPTGAVAVAPLSDDLVIWGDDSQLYLQQLNAKGGVLETRVLGTSGFSTGLQLVDVDGDRQLDVVVLNSSGLRSDVIYGPLWDRATRRN